MPAGDAARIDPAVGLCSACRNARVVESRRGSRFWLCRLSEVDDRFPRYPRLPVRACDGFERAAGKEGRR